MNTAKYIHATGNNFFFLLILIKLVLLKSEQGLFYPFLQSRTISFHKPMLDDLSNRSECILSSFLFKYLTNNLILTMLHNSLQHRVRMTLNNKIYMFFRYIIFFF
jgi:hypothetical protein